jgi:peptidoglycan/LPS O-acetylase OafA/YrhL
VHLPPNAWLYVGIGAAVCIVVALGVYWFVETPVLNFLRRRFEPRRAELSA